MVNPFLNSFGRGFLYPHSLVEFEVSLLFNLYISLNFILNFGVLFSLNFGFKFDFNFGVLFNWKLNLNLNLNYGMLFWTFLSRPPPKFWLVTVSVALIQCTEVLQWFLLRSFHLKHSFIESEILTKGLLHWNFLFLIFHLFIVNLHHFYFDVVFLALSYS